jgi:ZIP family zinc transporter
MPMQKRINMVEDTYIAFLFTTLAGLSTGIGGLIAYFIKKPKFSYLSFLLGFSAGVMIYVSFVELLGKSINEMGFLLANICFFGGIVGIYFVDKFIPHIHLDTKPDPFHKIKHRKKLMAAGVFTAIGIAIHNFPEGMAVLAVSLDSLALGLPIAFAIAVHNIPEGIAVSVPIYYATGNRKKAFVYSFLSGVAEPAGATIGYLLLLPFLTPMVLYATLAVVAGIMVFICFDELLPISKEYGSEHLSTFGLFLGMVVMMLSLSV